MSEHYEEHSEQIADAFIDLLDTTTRAGIDDDQRKELAMMIEAAISTAVFEQLEQVADDIAALSDEVRRHTEHYDEAD